MKDDQSLTADYRSAGYLTRLELGVRPALLIVDFVKAYLLEDSPLYGGEGIRAALRGSIELLAAARRASIPIFHTNLRYDKDGHSGGVFFRKVPALRSFAEGSESRSEASSPRVSSLPAMRPSSPSNTQAHSLELRWPARCGLPTSTPCSSRASRPAGVCARAVSTASSMDSYRSSFETRSVTARPGLTRPTYSIYRRNMRKFCPLRRCSVTSQSSAGEAPVVAPQRLGDTALPARRRRMCTRLPIASILDKSGNLLEAVQSCRAQ